MKSILGIVILLVFPSFVIGQDSLGMTNAAVFDIHPGEEYNDIWGYTDSLGNDFAIVGSESHINIVNINNCDDPVLDTAYSDGSSVIWRDFKTYEHFVYGICDGSACNNEGLEIIDMNTREFKQITTDFNKAHNIYIEESTGRLYVVGVNGSTDLIIYDLTIDPWNPVLLSAIDFGNFVPNYIHDIYVKDTIAYASHGYAGYVIYNVADANNVTYLKDYTNSTAYNHSSWVSDDKGYSYTAFEVPTGVPIDIYKIHPNFDIQKKGSFTQPLIANAPTDNRPHNPFVKGDSLYISYYHDGVQVWNIVDRENPTLVSYYDTEPNNTNYNGYTGSWGMYPYSPKGCIVASDINRGLFTFELDRPEVQMKSNITFMDANANLVFKEETGTYKKVSLDVSGGIVLNTHTPPADASMLENSNTYFNGNDISVILKAPSGRSYKLVVDANNTIFTEFVPTIPAGIESFSDFVFDDFEKGIILRTADDRRVKVKLDAMGNLVAEDWHPSMN